MTDPQEFAVAGEKLSVNVNYQLGDSWGIGQMNVKFDMEDIQPGYITANAIDYAKPDGNAYLYESYEGPIVMNKAMMEGNKGDKKAVIMNLGNGYGFKYYYEWRE